MIIEIVDKIAPWLAVLPVIFLINERVKDFFRFHADQVDLAPKIRAVEIDLIRFEEMTLLHTKETQEKITKLEEMITKITLKGM